MSTSTTTGPTAPTAGHSSARRWPGFAGATYVVAWVVGLTAFGFGPSADASDAEVVRYVTDHRAVSAMQSVLVHGVAALALCAVIVAVARSQSSTRTSTYAGFVAVGLSLVQCVLGLWRSLVSTGSTTTALVDAIDRVDGFKMFALAVMIGASIASLRSAGMIGRRMAVTGRAATVALVVSGVAFAGGIQTLMVSAAAAALVLLLVWVGYVGVAAGGRSV